MSRSRSSISLQTWVSMAMLTAVAYVVMLLSKSLPQINGFLQMDLKDTIICIGGFLYGPLSAAIISIVVAVVEMFTYSDTGPIGCLMNIISTASFCCTAGFIYKRVHTKRGAVLGLSLAVVVMVIVMLLWNYLITPVYQKVPRDVVVGMLPTVFLPFNLVKGGLNMAISLLLYKPVVTALRKARLAPESRSKQSADGIVTLNGEPVGRKGGKAGFLLFSLALLITFGTLTLVLMGII